MARFPAKHTSGDDQIPSFIVHDVRFALVRPLLYIINLAISSSTFPSLWKRARITPVYKKDDKTQLKNYRPIAILSNFAKLFEQVIYTCIFNGTHRYISTNQHGFLPRRSTTTNLLNVTQYIAEEMDKRGQTDVIYTDFSSAFDTVDHNLLLNKLSAFGLVPSLVRLMESYLSNRINYVFYNGFKSSEYMSTSGVPQGSNLGPLLFVLCIDDLVSSLTCNVLGFADDLKIVSTIKDFEDIVKLQQNLNKITMFFH